MTTQVTEKKIKLSSCETTSRQQLVVFSEIIIILAKAYMQAR